MVIAAGETPSSPLPSAAVPRRFLKPISIPSRPYSLAPHHSGPSSSPPIIHPSPLQPLHLSPPAPHLRKKAGRKRSLFRLLSARPQAGQPGAAPSLPARTEPWRAAGGRWSPLEAAGARWRPGVIDAGPAVGPPAASLWVLTLT